MTVQEAYERYRIMPMLQLHQLRVAAVAGAVGEMLLSDVDMQSVVLACLFHDMGNIIKSDLAVFPEFSEPEGVAHWELVKREFLDRYGADEQVATIAIARELGLPHAAVALIEHIGFSLLEETRDRGTFENKLCEYADLRVGPHGVLSLRARIDEAHARYRGRRTEMPDDEARFEELTQAAHDIERQLFADVMLAPEDITEQSVQESMRALRSYQLP